MCHGSGDKQLDRWSWQILPCSVFRQLLCISRMAEAECSAPPTSELIPCRKGSVHNGNIVKCGHKDPSDKN